MTYSDRLPGLDNSWVVVLNRTLARIYTRRKKYGDLVLEVERRHEEGRAHQQDLTSDLPGKTFDRQGQGRHRVDGDRDPRAAGIEKFVRQVSSDVEHGRVNGSFQQLMLIAPPKILGLLRNTLSAESRGLISLEVPKQMAHEDPATVSELIDRERP